MPLSHSAHASPATAPSKRGSLPKPQFSGVDPPLVIEEGFPELANVPTGGGAVGDSVVRGGYSLPLPTSNSWLQNEEAFSELSQSNWQHAHARGSGVPLDTTAKGFRYTASKKSFSFDDVAPNNVKLKSIPFEFCQASNGAAAVPMKKALSCKRDLILADSGVEPPGQRQWFRSPPKIQVVADILRYGPTHGTRGGGSDGGEREAGGDSESNHSVSSSPPLPTTATTSNQLSPICNPSRPKSNHFLTKFVEHFQRGSSTRSFAATMRAKPAPTVKVGMNHGGGHRGNYGAGREEFGVGRQGRGGGAPLPGTSLGSA